MRVKCNNEDCVFNEYIGHECLADEIEIEDNECQTYENKKHKKKKHLLKKPGHPPVNGEYMPDEWWDKFNEMEPGEIVKELRSVLDEISDKKTTAYMAVLHAANKFEEMDIIQNA